MIQGWSLKISSKLKVLTSTLFEGELKWVLAEPQETLLKRLVLIKLNKCAWKATMIQNIIQNIQINRRRRQDWRTRWEQRLKMMKWCFSEEREREIGREPFELSGFRPVELFNFWVCLSGGQCSLPKAVSFTFKIVVLFCFYFEFWIAFKIDCLILNAHFIWKARILNTVQFDTTNVYSVYGNYTYAASNPVF